jgi:hypothetical protein
MSTISASLSARNIKSDSSALFASCEPVARRICSRESCSRRAPTSSSRPCSTRSSMSLPAHHAANGGMSCVLMLATEAAGGSGSGLLG